MTRLINGLMGVVGLWVGLSVGCAPYINIPPQAGDVAWHDPNNPTVQDVMTQVVRAVVAQHPFEGPYLVALPDGTVGANASKLIASLNGQPTNASGDHGTQAQSFIQVEQIRVRGTSGSVDVVRRDIVASPDTAPQLMTVGLQWHAGDGWQVDRLRVWRTHLDQPQHARSTSVTAYP